ncbi:MAG: glycosyltransferase family 4 protein [Prevotella sp.]|nr:glycosyltransferase family 4 protein [Prevotella sp.]
MKNLLVYLYDIRKPYVGLGEFQHQLATRMAGKARLLREEHGVKLWMMVPPQHVGRYGGEVEYVALTRFRLFVLRHKWLKALSKTFLPEAALTHWMQQLPKLSYRLSPATLVTIHDINFVHNGLSKQAFLKRMRRMQHSLDTATHLSFISQFTADDVKAYFSVGQPSRVIVNGVTKRGDNNVQESCRSEWEGEENFLFHMSGLGRKKNAHLLVEMMRYLPDERLYIAGKGEKGSIETLERLTDRHHLTNVRLLGVVSEGEKTWLYAHCKAFFFPSLSEGFGLPVVEAMSYGKPVFISRLTSLPEVGGRAACYFDELSAESMAEVYRKGIADYAENKEERVRTLERQASLFSWDKAADAYMAYYLDILSAGEDV